MINFYTDGSCRKNPGPGGYSVIRIDDDDKIIYVYKQIQEELTTNNIMELRGILDVFKLSQTEQFKNEKIIIHTDSAYCCNMCNDWIWNWANNGWKRTKNQEILNLEIVKEMFTYLSIPFFNCMVKRVKGHDGLLGNEMADAIACHNDLKVEKLLKESRYSIVYQE